MLVHEQLSQGEDPTSPVGTQHTPTVIETSPQLQNIYITYRTTRTRSRRMGIRISQSNVLPHVADEAITKEMHDGLGRATTTASSLEAEQGSGNISKTQTKATPSRLISLRTSSEGGLGCHFTMGVVLFRLGLKGYLTYPMNHHSEKSPSEHPEEKGSLDAPDKLTRAKLNKRSREADMSKDISGPESPPELWSSWCIEGHIRFRVISSVLAQRYLRIIRQRESSFPEDETHNTYSRPYFIFSAFISYHYTYSYAGVGPGLTPPRRANSVPSYFQLGDEGVRSEGTKLIQIFIKDEEEIWGAKVRYVGTETYGGPTEPVLQRQKTPSSSLTFIKENIDVLRTMIKEHDQQAKTKATPRRLAYADYDKEVPARSLARGFFDRFSLESSGTSDTYKQTRSANKSQRTPSKNKEPTHPRRSRRFEDQSITKEKTRRKRSKSRGKRSGHQETSSESKFKEGSKDTAKLPRNIRVYEGNKDLEDHLGIFSAAVGQEEWPIPIWCKMFRQPLSGAAQNWFDDLDPKSVDSFEELSQKFLEEFSQQKRYAKDPLEIHDIKRRQNEGLQAFMDRFKSESSHINGVPPVLRISAFMHGHGHPELAKKLNDKIPKTLDEMFERVRAFVTPPNMGRSGMLTGSVTS
ncbi:reverse transcriptase domain-containing protein [Tanacetum coccineum]